MNTKVIKIMDLQAGMRLARDYFEHDQLKFKKGIPLTKEQVEHVQRDWQRRMQRFREQEDIANQRKHVKETKEFKQFSGHYEKGVIDAEIAFNSVLLADEEVDMDAMCTMINEMIEDCGESFGNIVVMLNNMEGYDDSTYAHCINVSMLATLIGKKMGFSDDELQTLSVGGLLHDVGKLSIPENILKKAGKLSDAEYELVKNHSVDGYNQLKDKDLNEDVLMCVLQHHEKCDGSGYPYALKRDDINKYAKIVAIADVYDALTSQRAYKEAMCPFIAAEIFEEESYEKYEVEYLLPFLHYIVEVYVGMDVILSNGEEARVVMINQDNLSKPLIKTEQGFVDLAKSEGVTITEIK